MPNKARREVDNQTRLIRKLMDTDNLNKQQIIDQLQIDERTFRRYLTRIMKQDAKLHEQQNKDAVQYRESRFHKALEDAYLINKRIAEDTRMPAMARIDASKTMVTCQAQLAKLAKYGLVFTPQTQAELPNKVVEVEGKEVTI